MNKLIKALSFRHACKLFDENKKINEQDLQIILEAGRLSPSSFGLEPWHFLVITDPNVKQRIRKVCWDQPQITSCSHLMFALFRRGNQFHLDSGYLRTAMQRNLPANADKQAVDKVSQRFIDYYQNNLAKEVNVDLWAEMQCYIACANMMTAAAYQEIDSCAIGGFDYYPTVEILENVLPWFNNKDYGIALGIAFGYRVNPAPEKIRWSQKDIFTFI
ncbi:MAG: NAD(P)H-dependent oxidoreductase [Candidatus Schmidhempelia sp.]|nr:NAD(P)H-dependent oxidoreductase [Candidatus Schmidhempelia sp.]